VRARRLEDRIRELCAKALTAHDSELDVVFPALQLALHQHSDRLRKLAADKLAAWQPRGNGVAVVTTVSRASFACAICVKPVLLEDSKVSEDGQPIHEECYVAKLILSRPLSQAQQTNGY
jgi:hypothetical protein